MMRLRNKIASIAAASALAIAAAIAVPTAAMADDHDGPYTWTCGAGQGNSASVPFRLGYTQNGTSGSGYIVFERASNNAVLKQGNYSFPGSQPGIHRKLLVSYYPGVSQRYSAGTWGSVTDIYGTIYRGCNS